MLLAHVVCIRYIMQNEVVVLGAAQANSSASTCCLFYEIGLFQSSVWYTCMYNFYKGYS
jgi:hypothetical protein